MQLKRNIAKEVFQKEIDGMYKAIKEQSAKQPIRSAL